MLIVSRTVDYSGLLDMLRGKRVAIWTCNTCARLCNGIGGKESAERLAAQLRKDGINVLSVISVAASCIMDKVAEASEDRLAGMCDVIVTLVCDVGSNCASMCFDKEIVNPVDTLGYGYLDENRMPVLADGRVVMMGCSPFVDL